MCSQGSSSRSLAQRSASCIYTVNLPASCQGLQAQPTASETPQYLLLVAYPGIHSPSAHDRALRIQKRRDVPPPRAPVGFILILQAWRPPNTSLKGDWQDQRDGSALAALAEDLGSVPSTHMGAHNCP